MLLKKGLEIELYAGTKEGEVLPLSSKLQEKFPGFSQEPDERNFEYITNPVNDYDILFSEIINPRIEARRFLKTLDDLTIIPGSSIPLEYSKISYPSKTDDPYHQFILKTYKTNIITTSLHINIGIEDTKSIFNLISALRLDLPLFLALSASSPFHDGKVTGFKSFRWHNFPRTPSFVPFFSDHNEYISWSNEKLKNKEMFNVRHLWSGIRPNGPNRPNDLNRIEIRICDLVSDTRKVISIVAFIEAIIQNYLINNNWPKILSKKKEDLIDLAKTIDQQEEVVAKDGLNAKIWDWRSDSVQDCSIVIESLYKELMQTSKKLGISSYIDPINDILSTGNEATLFLKKYNNEKSIAKTVQYFTEQFNILDLKYKSSIDNTAKANI